MGLSYQQRAVLAAVELSRQSQGREGYEVRSVNGSVHLRPLGDMETGNATRYSAIVVDSDRMRSDSDYLKDHISRLEEAMNSLKE